MQIKTTMRYDLTPARMDIIKISTNNAREGMERRELAYSVGGNENWYSHYGEQYGDTSKKEDTVEVESQLHPE